MFGEKDCPIPEPFSARVGSILFLTLLFYLGFISQFIFAPLMPTIENELGMSHSQAGSLFLFVSLGFFVTQLCSGFISSFFKHRGALIISAVAVGIVLCLFSFTNSIWTLRIVMFVLGIAIAPHMPSAIASITAMVSRQDWGKALAVHQSAPALALVSAPLLSILFLEWLGISWRIVLAFLGAAALISAFAYIVFGRGGEFPGEAPRPVVVKAILAHRSYWIMIVLFALSMGASSGIYTMLPLFLVNERGFDTGWANTVLGISRIVGPFLTFLGGWLVDRIGEKKVISTTLIVAGASTLLLGVVTGAWLILVIFLQAALISFYFPAGFSALSRITDPNIRSVATSLATPPAFLLGNGVLPAFIGYMGQSYSFGLGITITGCLIMLGSILVIFLKLLDNTGEGC